MKKRVLMLLLCVVAGSFVIRASDDSSSTGTECADYVFLCYSEDVSGSAALYEYDFEQEQYVPFQAAIYLVDQDFSMRDYAYPLTDAPCFSAIRRSCNERRFIMTKYHSVLIAQSRAHGYCLSIGNLRFSIYGRSYYLNEDRFSIVAIPSWAVHISEKDNYYKYSNKEALRAIDQWNNSYSDIASSLERPVENQLVAFEYLENFVQNTSLKSILSCIGTKEMKRDLRAMGKDGEFPLIQTALEMLSADSCSHDSTSEESPHEEGDSPIVCTAGVSDGIIMPQYVDRSMSSLCI